MSTSIVMQKMEDIELAERYAAALHWHGHHDRAAEYEAKAQQLRAELFALMEGVGTWN